MNEEALSDITGNDNFSKAFGEILSNPEMMSAISSMAQKLKAEGKATEAKNTSPDSDTKEEHTESTSSSSSAETASLVGKFPELLGLLSSKGASTSKNRRSDLLCALKPYLSQSRIDAIDQIIKLSELSSVFKNLS